jgi:ATP-dependent helicase HepA
MRDESEALLDEGSFQAAGAERFRKEPDLTLERELEEAFVAFYRASGRDGAVRHTPDERAKGGLWRFRPDEIHDGPLAIVDQDGKGELSARTGTFRRETARHRRDVEFFTWGNPLFDAVEAALVSRTTGRTYAIEVRAANLPPLLGIEAIVSLRPDLSRLAEQPGLQELARGFLGTRRRIFHYSLVPGQDARVIDRVRRSIRPEHLGRVCRDIGVDRLHAIISATGQAWPDFVANCESAALSAAQNAFKAELDEVIASERRRIDDMLLRMRSVSEDTSSLADYLAALEHWSPALDSLGVMAINWGGA